MIPCAIVMNTAEKTGGGGFHSALSLQEHSDCLVVVGFFFSLPFLIFCALKDVLYVLLNDSYTSDFVIVNVSKIPNL